MTDLEASEQEHLIVKPFESNTNTLFSIIFWFVRPFPFVGSIKRPCLKIKVAIFKFNVRLYGLYNIKTSLNACQAPNAQSMLRLFFSYAFFYISFFCFAGIWNQTGLHLLVFMVLRAFTFVLQANILTPELREMLRLMRIWFLMVVFFLLRFDEIIFSLDADADVDTPSYLSTITIKKNYRLNS